MAGLTVALFGIAPRHHGQNTRRRMSQPLLSAAPASPRRRSKKVLLLAAGFAALFTLGLCELCCTAVVRLGFVPARVPPYAITASKATFWGDLSSEFGAWHPPLTQYRHQKACFDVLYESNSYGARDVERQKTSTAFRVVALGDSFMEGFGVRREDRLSDQIESRTGIACLNFGTSGNAGSAHAYAIYRSLASQFEHGAVLASILPENDFDDDEPKPDRYQPYWSGSHPDYELRFSSERVSDSAWSATQQDQGVTLVSLLRDFTHTQNVIDLVYSGFKQRRTQRKFEGDVSTPESRFFRYSKDEFLRLTWSYERLAALAAPRPLVLFTIPRIADLAAISKEGRSPLDEELAAWAAKQPNVRFVALARLILGGGGDEASAMFLSCDPHWNAHGHARAAELLLAECGDALKPK